MGVLHKGLDVYNTIASFIENIPLFECYPGIVDRGIMDNTIKVLNSVLPNVSYACQFSSYDDEGQKNGYDSTADSNVLIMLEFENENITGDHFRLVQYRQDDGSHKVVGEYYMLAYMLEREPFYYQVFDCGIGIHSKAYDPTVFSRIAAIRRRWTIDKIITE